MAKNKTKAPKEKKTRDRVSLLLYMLYLGALLIGGAIIYKIVDIQSNFSPSPRVLSEITNRNKKVPIEPKRGQILASDGRILAMSYTTYTVAMDCTVKYKEHMGDQKAGPEKEQEWREKAKQLAEGLAKLAPGKSAQQYYETIINNRIEGKKYWVIAKDLDNKSVEKFYDLPLFDEPRNVGGLIIEKHNTRRYPYGELGRRVIGKVNNNAETDAKSHYGIEGKFESKLHGTNGYEWMRPADGSLLVHNFDSTYKSPVDGQDVRTTIDVDIQDMLDRAIRSRIKDADHVDKFCGIVMDVNTGAIRAMVNLTRYSANDIREDYNYCIGNAGEPGSVFKVLGLSGLIEDGYVKSTAMTVPTNKGYYKQTYGKGKVKVWSQDDYIYKWEQREKVNYISVKDALKISSNMVFRYLVNENYKNDPQKYIDKIYSAKLGEAFDFDISGLATPRVKNYTDAYGQKQSDWSPIDLPAMAIGYSVQITPLHIAMLYNCIANGGKMMRPYLVEDLERDGKVTERRGPSVLNASVFSQNTADMITEALTAVTTEDHGTAYNSFKGCPVTVAGKTGTSWKDVPKEEQGKDGYHDKQGRFRHQGTFVGFFPAENPQYTILISGWSKRSHTYLYGGTLPAQAAREVVEGIYRKDQYWREPVRGKGELPEAEKAANAAEPEMGIVPDVSGMTLSEAVWAIESAGYTCSFSGTGHVSSQKPKAGTKSDAGLTVIIELK